MADSQPPEGPIDPPPLTVAAEATTSTPLLPASADNNNVFVNKSVGSSLAPKRQRRPSVRLGEIGGDQPATLSHDSLARRPRPWRFHDPGLASKTSKTRPLTNLVNGGGGGDYRETLDSGLNLEFGIRKSKSKRPTKRTRTVWATPKLDNNGGAEGDSREGNNEEFRDFEPGVSDSPVKEQSPIHSIDDVAADLWNGHRRPDRARVSVSRDHDDVMPESNSRDPKCGSSRERNFVDTNEKTSNRFLDDGVRNWLIGLGLGRYAPVFEIHEVDDEILPMLTLEDLKDMGINAVGSRRKMYSAIQKLQKRFS